MHIANEYFPFSFRLFGSVKLLERRSQSNKDMILLASDNYDDLSYCSDESFSDDNSMIKAGDILKGTIMAEGINKKKKTDCFEMNTIAL